MEPSTEAEEEIRYSVCVSSVRLDKLPEGLEEAEEIGIHLWLDGHLPERIHPPFDPEEDGTQFLWEFNPKLCWRSSGESPQRLHLKLFDQEDEMAVLPTGAQDLPDFNEDPNSLTFVVRTRHPEKLTPGPTVFIQLSCYTGDDDDIIEDIPLNMVSDRLGEFNSRSLARRRYCVEAKALRINGHLGLTHKDRLVIEMLPELPPEVRTSRIPRFTKSILGDHQIWDRLDGLCRWTTARGSKAFLTPPRRIRCELRLLGQAGYPEGLPLGHCTVELDKDRFENSEAAFAEHNRLIFLNNLEQLQDAEAVSLVVQTSCMVQEFRPEEYVGFNLAEDEGRLVVESVDDHSEAQRVGIQPGLQLLSVNDEELHTLPEYEAARSKVWLGEVYRFQFVGPLGETLPNDGFIELEFQEAPNGERPRAHSHRHGWGHGGNLPPADSEDQEGPSPEPPVLAAEEEKEKEKAVMQKRSVLVDWWTPDSADEAEDPDLPIYRRILSPRDAVADGELPNPRPTLVQITLQASEGIGERVCCFGETAFARVGLQDMSRCLTPIRGSTNRPAWPAQPLYFLLENTPLQTSSSSGGVRFPHPLHSSVVYRAPDGRLLSTATAPLPETGVHRVAAQESSAESRLAVEATQLPLFDLFSLHLDGLQLEFPRATPDDHRGTPVQAVFLQLALPGAQEPIRSPVYPLQDPSEVLPEDLGESRVLNLRHRFPFHLTSLPTRARLSLFATPPKEQPGYGEQLLGITELQDFGQLLQQPHQDRWLRLEDPRSGQESCFRIRLGLQAAQVPAGSWLDFQIHLPSSPGEDPDGRKEVPEVIVEHLYDGSWLPVIDHSIPATENSEPVPARAQLHPETRIRFRTSAGSLGQLESKPLSLGQFKGFQEYPVLLRRERPDRASCLIHVTTRVLESPAGVPRALRKREFAPLQGELPNRVSLALEYVHFPEHSGILAEGLSLEARVDEEVLTRSADGSGFQPLSPEPSQDHFWDPKLLRLDSQVPFRWSLRAPASDPHLPPRDLQLRFRNLRSSQPVAVARIDLSQHAEPLLHDRWISRRVPLLLPEDPGVVLGSLSLCLHLTRDAAAQPPKAPLLSSEAAQLQPLPTAQKLWNFGSRFTSLLLALVYLFLAMAALEFVFQPPSARAVGGVHLPSAYFPFQISFQGSSEWLDSVFHLSSLSGNGTAAPLLPKPFVVDHLPEDLLSRVSWTAPWSLEWLCLSLLAQSHAAQKLLTAFSPKLLRSGQVPSALQNLLDWISGSTAPGILLVLFSFAHRLPGRARGIFQLRAEGLWILIGVLSLGALVQWLRSILASPQHPRSPLHSLERRDSQLRFATLAEVLLVCVAATMAIPVGPFVSQFVILAGAIPFLVSLAMEERLEDIGRLCFLGSLLFIEQSLRLPAALSH